MGSEFLVDCVLPVYKEESYLAKTLHNLSEQSLYKAGQVNIIVSEYNPDNNSAIKNMCDLYDNVTHSEVVGKGISFGRRMGIKRGSAPYIVNFDADSILESSDGLEKLVTPLQNDGDLVYTFCDNIPMTDDVLSLQIYHQLNQIQRLSPLMSIFECGLTLRRTSYENIGGFDSENRMWECMDLTSRIALGYGSFCKQWVDTRILTSDRRISKIRTHGIQNVLNYDKNQFR